LALRSVAGVATGNKHGCPQPATPRGAGGRNRWERGSRRRRGARRLPTTAVHRAAVAAGNRLRGPSWHAEGQRLLPPQCFPGQL